MDALLAEAVVGRQLDLDGDDLPERWQGLISVQHPPCDKNSAPADIFRVHSAPHPHGRRSHMAAELDFDSRTLTPIDGFHLRASTLANLAPPVRLAQYRKWVTHC